MKIFKNYKKSKSNLKKKASEILKEKKYEEPIEE